MTNSNSSISRDIFIFSFVVIFILLLVSLWVSYKTYDDQSDIILTQLKNQTLRIDRNLTVEIKNATYLLESLGRQINQNGAKDKKYISQLLRSFDEETHEDTLYWIDENQNVIISSSHGELEKKVDISDRDYSKKSLIDPWKPKIGRPILGRVSEKWVLPIAMGVTDYKGNHMGTLLVSLNIDILTKSIHNEIKKDGINFAIFSKTLSPLTEYNSDDKDLPIDVLAKIDFDEKPTGILSVSTLFKRDVPYVSYAVSAKYPYVILISYDESQIISEFISKLFPKILQAVVIALFLLALLWMVRTHIIIPLEKLSKIAGNMIKGGKYHPIKGQITFELEELALHIENLGNYIDERMNIEDGLRIKNAQLSVARKSISAVSAGRMKFVKNIINEVENLAKNIEDASAELIKSGKCSCKHPEFTEIIYRDSLSIANIIYDTKFVLNIEKKFNLIRESDVNISFALHKAIREFYEQCNVNNIEIKLQIEEEFLPTLTIDEHILNELLLTVFSHASANAGQMRKVIMLDCSFSSVDMDELILMIKYDENDFHPELYSENKPIGNLKTKIVAKEFTKMLADMQNIKIEIRSSLNQINRIYIKFPSNLLNIDKDEV